MAAAKAGVPFEPFEYDYDPNADSLGLAVVDALAGIIDAPDKPKRCAQDRLLTDTTLCTR